MQRLTRTLSFSAIAATLFSASAAFAAPPAAAPQPNARHEGPMMQHNLDRIHSQLKLNASQEQLWQTALKTMRSDHQQARALHEQAKQQMNSLMQAPVLDLSALQKQRDQTQAQEQKLRANTETGWLNLYNALDASQKVTASNFLKERWQKMEHHHGKLKPLNAMAPAPAVSQ